jgi:molybdenum cofactor biosynthesis protein A
MPAEGIKYLPKKELLTFEEIHRLISLLASMGISKIRLTGGEPFVRNDLMKLIRSIVEIPGIKDLHLTTNGILTAPHIPELKRLGIASVNLSLDTLDRKRFHTITLRDEFESTYRTLNLLLENEIPVKINTVVMDGKNTDDIISLIELTKNQNVSVRFIEEMPFNGEGNHYPTLVWTYKKILDHIRERYPMIQKTFDPENSTSMNYQIPGYKGNVGVIAAFSRTFCGTCNRLRVTAQGTLKTCLYDDGVLNLRDVLRETTDNNVIKEKLQRAFQLRPANGFEAEKNRNNKIINESMSTIGG